MTYLVRLGGSGMRPTSTLARLGGVCSRVEGVDPLEDPAVEGLPSLDPFLPSIFFREGTPSGQVH